jgi:hypothetical protein
VAWVTHVLKNNIFLFFTFFFTKSFAPSERPSQLGDVIHACQSISSALSPHTLVP